MIKLALFGWPIAASLSPLIHRSFAQQLGLKIDFQRIESKLDGFVPALERFRLNGGIGCNVTLPLKGEAYRLATQASIAVNQAQAANTLVWQAEAGWFADNTDGPGLLRDITHNHGINLQGQRLLILGAGGAAAGIIGSLQSASPKQIMLVNRNDERAITLSGRFESGGEISATRWQDLNTQGSFDLVINATSLGHQGKSPPVTATMFSHQGVCYDLNYHKASQPLRRRCTELGQKYIDGIGMLVEQAAKSFALWTGEHPESQEVIKQCRRQLSRSS